MAVRVFVAECGLSRVEVSRGCSSLQHMGFTRWWRLFLQAHRRPQLRHAGLVTPQHVGCSWTREGTCVPRTGGRILNYWSTREVFELLSECVPA